ncbi:MAG: PolC-type DNA polymerase III [Bacillota bacterium]
MQNKILKAENLLDKYNELFEIKSLKVFQKSRKWELSVKLKDFSHIKDIKIIEDTLASAYNLSDVKITVEQGLQLIQESSSVIKNHWSDIKQMVFSKNPSLMGFLKDSTIDVLDNNAVITVPTKVIADYLLVRKCDRLFEGCINDYFKLNNRVIIKYKEETFKEEEYLEKIIQEEEKIIKSVLENKQGTGFKADSKSGVPGQNNIIYGKPFADMPLKISELNEDSGRVTIEGSIFNVEVKPLNNGKTIISFSVTDNTNSITVKLFIKEESSSAKLIENITEGRYVRIKGDVQHDTYAKEIVIYPLNIVEGEKYVRTDEAEVKRIELHAHTSMSTMDGICSVEQLIKRAKEWGHKAIAITDHGVVQAFPEAYEAGKKAGIKIIYGVEGYFINDGIPIVYGEADYDFEKEFVVFDIETTGLSPINDKITEIGAVKLKNGKIVESFSKLINPEIAIPAKIIELTGITDDMVKNERTIREVLPEFLSFVGDLPLVAHNASFDWGFIKAKAAELNLEVNNTVIDTLQLSRALLIELKKHKLNIICEHLGIKLENHHRAADDAAATAYVFVRFIEMLKEREIYSVSHINSKLMGLGSSYKNLEANHIIILVKNQTGLKNLYKLISISHLDYFYKKPRIPKSLLLQYREGLIIGSACEAGEIFKGILNNMDENLLFENAKLYDYLEIQPAANNEFLVRNGRLTSIEDLYAINKRILRLGEKLNKPVIATGDVHFLEPEDEVYRRILMAGQGFTDADQQGPFYLKTTEEMLKDFSYLGKEASYKVVVENPNKLIEDIDDIVPVPEETYPPRIEGSEEQIRTLSMTKAHSIYGDKLPEIVDMRLEKELNSIINNGYAVMYLIAQKLVTKSLQDGYLVGSRGSVGSSFVATMCDITEVNPLPPHYICPNCKHSEFSLDGTFGCGVDMPDKECPNCGTKYKKDGFDIPFETFLGFDGDKEPDIDLNFAGEYQAEAHKYTEELFGKGYVFRAGTIGTIAEKTAYGFVKKYADEKQLRINNAETGRLVKGCTGIKRTTGQHPGGVMIVPDYKEIYDFTPIQRPADDTSSNIITTHFDYHSISGRILKLDILGHDVPTIIKMLEDLTGFKATDIPLDDASTMSLFNSTEALGINLDDIDCKSGSLGIPEFGTKFVRQMLMETTPQSFADLVRISGLSHGTDVWINNAQELVKNGICKLKDVIPTRDDIMVYLMYAGLKPKSAFKIMEMVRKGKGLTPEFEQEMREKGVPDWYIESCKKIKYMFPKAHAAAYVMMSFRIAYYKVYYPEAFYATFFYAKLDDFDADLLTKGKDFVKAKWIEIDRLGNNATTKEKNLMTLLEVVYEMYLRGIKLLPVDLYLSDASKFQITKDGILPPLSALQGLGINAALSIVNAREESHFISVDELRERAKVSKTVIEILRGHGCLKDLPEYSQLSLF